MIRNYDTYVHEEYECEVRPVVQWDIEYIPGQEEGQDVGNEERNDGTADGNGYSAVWETRNEDQV